MKVMKEGVDGLENVVQQVEYQLSSVSLFTDEGIQQDLKHVTVTNSKCESNFGKLDYTLSQTCGAFVLHLVSNKNIIKSNSSLEQEKFRRKQLWFGLGRALNHMNTRNLYRNTKKRSICLTALLLKLDAKRNS